MALFALFALFAGSLLMALQVSYVRLYIPNALDKTRQHNHARHLPRVRRERGVMFALRLWNEKVWEGGRVERTC